MPTYPSGGEKTSHNGAICTDRHRLYNDLRDNRIRAGLRLEYAHLSFGWVQERIIDYCSGTE